jgi:hypothetical protein
VAVLHMVLVLGVMAAWAGAEALQDLGLLIRQEAVEEVR